MVTYRVIQSMYNASDGAHRYWDIERKKFGNPYYMTKFYEEDSGNNGKAVIKALKEACQVEPCQIIILYAKRH